MTQGPGQPAPGVGEAMERLLGIPSPERVLVELQRLNNNIEIMAPDLQKLAKALDGLQGDDIRNLSAALNGVKVGDAIRVLNEFSGLARQIYDRLWGKT